MTIGRLGQIGNSNSKNISGVYSLNDLIAKQNSKKYLTAFSYDGKFNALTQAGAAQGFTFNTEGTVLLVCTPGTRATAKITRWAVSRFDITYATYQPAADFLCGDYEPNVNSISVTSGGYVRFSGTTNDTIWLGTLSLSGACVTPSNKKFYLGAQDATPRSTRFSSDAYNMYMLGGTSRNVYQYNLVDPYDLQSASYASKTLAVTQDTTPQHIFFRSDGYQMYMLGSTSRALFSYNLSAPWDIATGVSNYSAPLAYNASAQAAAPRSVFIGDSGTRMYVLGYVLGSPTIYQYNLSTAYNPTTATYASQALNVNARDTEPWEIFFKEDGTKMYLLGNTNDAIFSYTLSTPWSLATATLDYTQRAFTVTTQAAEPYSTYIGDNGTKMFVLNQATNAVFQYTLSTPYNVTTATYANKTLSVAAQETNSRGMFFKSDGTKMYIIGITSNIVFSYTLSTPWDVSTGTADYAARSFLVSTQSTVSTDLFIGNNGSTLYVLSGGAATTDTVFQYTLSTPWSITSASYANKSFSVNTQSTSSEGIYFKSDGTKMYILNNGGTNLDAIYQYSLSVAWDVSTASYDGSSLNISSQETVPTGLFFSSDGTRLYFGGQTGDDITQYTLTTPWAINTALIERTSPVLAEITQLGIHFKDDGTKMYVVGSTSQTIFEYTLSVAWDVSTISLSRSYSVAFLDTVPTGIVFNSDGTRVFIIGDTADRVHELRLTVPWQITSIQGRYSVLAEDTACNSIYISPDGSRMYITGQTGDDVNQYDLSIAWDTSSATFVRVSSTHGEATATGLFFKDDGSKMYVIGTTLDTIREFTLSTPWDVSTIALSKSRYVGIFDATPSGIHFSPDGLTMYITGATNNTVYQFALGQAWSSTYITGYMSIAPEETGGTGMYISPDGLNLYVTGNSGDDVNQYLLDVAWDISTANYVRVSAAIGETEPRGVFFSNDGTRMIVTGITNDEFREFTLGTPWNVSTAALSDTFYHGHLATAATCVHFSPDGLYMYWINTTIVYRFTLAEAFRCNKVVGTYCVNKEETVPTAFYITNDGYNLYVTGQTGDDINQYYLSTPWDITTVSYVRVSATHGEATVTGITFIDYWGTDYLAICGTTTDSVRIFTISNKDVSTMQFSYSFSTQFEANSSGLVEPYSNGGLDIVGTTNDCVYRLYPNFAAADQQGYSYIGTSEASIRSISQANDEMLYDPAYPTVFTGGSAIRKYDFSAGTNVSGLYGLTQTFAITEPYGIHINSSGTRIYVTLGTTAADKTGRSIRLVTMTTPFDLSTATLDSVEIIGAPGLLGNPANLWNIYVTPDEMKMFVMSPTVQGIYQFSRRFL